MAPQSRLSKLLSYLSSCCRYDNVRHFASRESRSAVGLCTGYAGDLQHGTSSLSAALITRRPQTPPRVARQGTPSRSAIQTRYTRCTRERGWSEFPSEVQSHLLKLKVQHMNTSYHTPSQHQRRRDGLHSRANMRILRGFSPRRHSRPRARARARAGVGSAVQRVRWRDPCGRVQRLLDPVRESPKPEPHAFFQASRQILYVGYEHPRLCYTMGAEVNKPVAKMSYRLD